MSGDRTWLTLGDSLGPPRLPWISRRPSESSTSIRLQRKRTRHIRRPVAHLYNDLKDPMSRDERVAGARNTLAQLFSSDEIARLDEVSTTSWPRKACLLAKLCNGDFSAFIRRASQAKVQRIQEELRSGTIKSWKYTPTDFNSARSLLAANPDPFLEPSALSTLGLCGDRYGCVVRDLNIDIALPAQLKQKRDREADTEAPQQTATPALSNGRASPSSLSITPDQGEEEEHDGSKPAKPRIKRLKTSPAESGETEMPQHCYRSSPSLTTPFGSLQHAPSPQNKAYRRHISPECPQGASNRTTNLLRELSNSVISNFRAIGRELLQNSHWLHSWEDLTDEYDEFARPRVFETRQCWLDGDDDAVRELALRAAAASTPGKDGMIVRRLGSTDTPHWTAAFNQLYHSRPTDPIYAVNIQVPPKILLQPSSKGIKPSMKLPIEVDGSCSRRSEPLLGFNFTPEGTVIDVHVDRGLHALSTTVGRGKKLWIFWPPNDENLKLLKRLRAEREDDNKVMRCRDMKHGTVWLAGPTEAVYIPPGWLHATITLEGSMLAGVTFSTPDSIPLMKRLLFDDVALNERDIWDTGHIFLEALQLGLQSSDENKRRKSALELKSFARDTAQSPSMSHALCTRAGAQFLKALEDVLTSCDSAILKQEELESHSTLWALWQAATADMTRANKKR